MLDALSSLRPATVSYVQDLELSPEVVSQLPPPLRPLGTSMDLSWWRSQMRRRELMNPARRRSGGSFFSFPIAWARAAAELPRALKRPPHWRRPGRAGADGRRVRRLFAHGSLDLGTQLRLVSHKARAAVGGAAGGA